MTRPRRRARWHGRGIAVLVALGLCTFGRPSVAAGPPVDREALAAKAQGHLERGELREAAQAYAAYYRALGSKRASPVGENAVLVAADAYRRAWEAGSDRADLLASRDLLREHLDAMQAETGSRTGAGADAAAAELDWVEQELARTEPEPAPEPPEPTPGQPAPVDPTPEQPAPGQPQPEPPVGPPRPAGPDAAPRDDASSRPRGPDKLGIGLVAGGAALVGGGVVLLGLGGTWGNRAESAVDDSGRTDSLVTGWLDDQRRTGRGLLIGGGVTVAVGIGLLAWGITRLVRPNRRAAALRVVPVPGGLAIMRRDRPVR